MPVIENFAELSEKEQREFAAALLKTINSEKPFTADTEFTIDEIEADELSGDLLIYVSTSDLLEVERDATWSCAGASNEDEEYDNTHATPKTRDVDFANSVMDDLDGLFKSKTVTLDEYTVSLSVDDIKELSVKEVADVSDTSDEDSGIGGYEYFGFTGYDSHPYIEVTGSLLCECDLAITLTVAPFFDAPAEPEAEEEI